MSGLFGGAGASGLFGQTTQPAAPSTHLFGSAAPATAGGLFGGAPATGGLFGGATATGAAPSMFGGGQQATAAASVPSGGGLFGSSGTTPTAAAAPAGSLLGSTGQPVGVTTTGGLFGGAASAPTQGLFGSATSTGAAAGGGLFGSSAAAAAGGGSLFGSGSAGGLFGGASKPPAAAGGAGWLGGSSFAGAAGEKVFITAKPTMAELLKVAPSWGTAVNFVQKSMEETQMNSDELKAKMRTLSTFASSTFRTLERKSEEVKNLNAMQDRIDGSLEQFQPSIHRLHRQCMSLQQNLQKVFGGGGGVPQPLIVPSTEYVAFLEDCRRRAAEVAKAEAEVATTLDSMRSEGSVSTQLEKLTQVLQTQTAIFCELHNEAAQNHQRVRAKVLQAQRKYSIRPLDTPDASQAKQEFVQC